MNRLEIPAKNIDVQYPGAWDEIKPEEAERIGEILYRCYVGQIDYDAARKLSVDVFLNRVNKHKKPMYGEESLTYWANESQLADTVDFLFTKSASAPGFGSAQPPVEQQETVTINPKFCIQLIPKVRIGWLWYTGPKDLLADLTILEWKEASWRVGKFARTLDEVYLDELFWVLYYRDMGNGIKVKSEDLRQKGVPVGVKFMAYLYFLGCMNWMREEAIEIDGEEIRFGCLFPAGEAGQKDDEQDNTGLAGILFQMAESGVFGNMEQTSKVNMWDVFLRLYQIHHQIKRMKT